MLIHCIFQRCAAGFMIRLSLNLNAFLFLAATSSFAQVISTNFFFTRLVPTTCNDHRRQWILGEEYEVRLFSWLRDKEKETSQRELK